jgi:hypothetical protein
MSQSVGSHGHYLPETAFRWQARRWRSWCITFLVLGLSAIRVPRTHLISVVILLRFVRVLSLDLSVIFATVALVTCVVAAVISLRKKIRGRGRRRSGVMLAPRITRFLIVPMGGPSVLAPARCPSIAFLLLSVVLLAALLRLLLDWKRFIRSPRLDLLANWRLCGKLGY